MATERIAVLFGGRIAEEIFMNQMTTGASNDFERATDMARAMVTRYGMSDELGPMVYGENEGEVFLGRSITRTVNMSEETMRKVDGEIRKIIDQQYAVARKLLEDNRDKVEAMAAALLELETIDADQIADIMGGKPSLTLELDSHVADAGLETRIEAFLDMLRRITPDGRTSAVRTAGGGR